MRIKIVSVLIVILLLAMSVPVYADTVIPNPPDDGYEYWVIYENYEGNIKLYKSNSPITVGPKGAIRLKLRDGYVEYIYENNKWNFVEQGSTKNVGFETIYAANHDIAYDDGSGFFFLRPKVSPLTQGMKETDFGTILRNFSAGLIPIVGLLILAIALTKGWRFLRGQLMT